MRLGNVPCSTPSVNRLLSLTSRLETVEIDTELPTVNVIKKISYFLLRLARALSKFCFTLSFTILLIKP